ncbi:fluoroquinolone transport system permease protein [Sedimentibacter acidaminivorans]|uniref:Fluoroquinolone transport system permease protein n=1 Tax=Sedimentibacter acidaminivorans TaxID=913099 RepID=A0ABS4GFZ5_9FIRM|nr:ABC transporter permease [Sedimentibacter acidaminivorans]MBP1926616.1 fluoroquinolone transport system permease protein [Sedimentibacter acidaminivorans]
MMTLITVKKLFISFRHLIHQISKDAMLFFVCISPLLCGLLIRFGIPFVENLLTEHFDKVILLPYYLIFDLFLAVITAAMFSFASAMVILGEIDDGITSYLAITPIGKSGYLVSRLVFPLISSLFMSIVVLIVFSLTRPSVSMIVIISIMASIFGFIMSMIVVSMSTNKVEGLAVMKLSNILTIGIIAPFLVSEKFQIIFFLFPSFWISKFIIENKFFDFVVFIVVSTVWVLLLLKKFIRKIK